VRILYHHRTLGDGAEGIHIAEMIKAFRALGHEVHVRGIAASENSGSPRAVVGKMKAALPRAAFELAAAATNIAEYHDIRRTIERVRPDFVYKRHARFDVGVAHAAKRARVPLVLEANCLFGGTHYHTFEPMVLGGLAAKFERRALELSDVVLAVSTPLAREITSAADVTPVVMPNGVDVERFDAARATPEPVRDKHGLGSGVVIGWAGVLREWHGLELLLDALVDVRDARLLIVGDGPARGALEQRAAAAGVADRMTITGRVPHDAMPDHLACMEVAVVADDRTRVASPMKLLEYMAMGRAAVAPRLDNITDIVTDEVDGLLFSPGDRESLARTLQRLVSDSTLRQALGRTARATVEQTRTWKHNARRVLSLVEERRARRNASS
jgi:glycosyltransferase involved in cell wall biosynthesis